jgi:hypothetical protein
MRRREIGAALVAGGGAANGGGAIPWRPGSVAPSRSEVLLALRYGDLDIPAAPTLKGRRRQ